MAETGQITDEGLARLRATIGIAVPHTQPPHYFRPNEDAFRHVAQSYGDANPLWSDPEYATKSVWGESVGPPALVGGDTLIGEDEVTTLSDDERALTKGDPLRGVHAFYASSLAGVVGSAARGPSRVPAQRVGRGARQEQRVRRPRGARVVCPGVPRR